MVEISKLKGYEEFKGYWITTCGKVISTKGRKRKVLKAKVSDSGNGYDFVILCNKNKRVSAFIHRLVALAYIPNDEDKPQVNHIDEVKNHNYVGNLEWVTAKENMNHGTCIKRAAESKRNPEEYYEVYAVPRYGFKIYCKRAGLSFSDFIEVETEERTKQGNIRYNYFRRA
jgi:hypothetical protein